MDAPQPRPRAKFVYVPALGPWLKTLLFVIFLGFALLGATGAYQIAVRAMEQVTGETHQTYVSLFVTSIHVIVGVGVLGPFFIFGFAHLVTAWNRPNKVAVRLGVVVFVLGIIASVTGILLVRLDGLPQIPSETITYWTVFWGHVITPILAIWAYVLHRKAGPVIQWKYGYGWSALVGTVIAVMLVLHSQNPQTWFAKGSAEGEKYFEPSRARTTDGKFINAHALMLDEYCMKCHEDVYKDHIHSAHRLSSFNNPAYLFSVRETRKAAGIRASRWCAGCHDPVPFFSGQFDDPNFDDEKNPTAHAGVTCVVCHAITHVGSRSGNGDYTIEEPQHYPFTFSENSTLQWLNNQLIKAKPDLHKKSFLKPFHRSEEFCSTCHKVGLPQEVNHYKEFTRGQNHSDSFFLSGVSGHGVTSFYYPPTGAKPNCAECHMSLKESNDFGSRDFDGSGVRKRHNHRFPGGNTGIHVLKPTDGSGEAITVIESFLKKGPDGKSPVLRADIFGLRKLTAKHQGVDAPLMENKPLRPFLPTLQPGQAYLVDVVVRTLNIGHHLTQGTVDSNELWVEFIARSGDKIIGRSGHLSGDEEGELDPNAHRINVLVLDRNGNRIDRRNPQDIFVPLYDHQIPPGAANVVHYRLEMPKTVTEPVDISVRVRYRKFDRKYMQYVYGDKPIAKLPIVDMGADKITLPVEGVAKAVPEQKSPIAPPWQRWNDYGIACYLEGGPEGTMDGELGMAKLAFEKVLSEEFKDFPERQAHGYLNLARVLFANRSASNTKNLDDARIALKKAREVQPPAPWQTVAWFNGLINVENVNFDEAIKDFENILDPANRDPVKRFDFTQDFRVINRLARTQLQAALKEEGERRTSLLRAAAERLESTLALDAESVEAHDLLYRIHALLGKAERKPIQTEPPSAEDLKLLAAIKSLDDTRKDDPERVENLRSVKEQLNSRQKGSPPPSVAVLLQAHRESIDAYRSSPNLWFRVGVSPIVNQLDQMLLQAMPGVVKIFTNAKADGSARALAGRELEEVLTQLNDRVAQEDMVGELVKVASLPTPGMPVQTALLGTTYRNTLQGPLPSPRLLTFYAARPGLRNMYLKADDPALKAQASRILGRMHHVMHGIFRVDDNARDRTVRLYRDRFPLAARQSQSIIIYDAAP